jgi:hypothetical protein
MIVLFKSPRSQLAQGKGPGHRGDQAPRTHTHCRVRIQFRPNRQYASPLVKSVMIRSDFPSALMSP